MVDNTIKETIKAAMRKVQLCQACWRKYVAPDTPATGQPARKRAR